MAATRFQGGWQLAVTEIASDLIDGGDILVNKVIIVKATAGTVTLQDGGAVTLLLTASLADASMTQIDFGGIRVSGLKYSATSAGTAVVYVYGTVVRKG